MLETTKFSPKLAILTIAGSFGALLMGWLAVVARGLYLARHLFTLSILCYMLTAFAMDSTPEVCCRASITWGRENLNLLGDTLRAFGVQEGGKDQHSRAG